MPTPATGGLFRLPALEAYSAAQKGRQTNAHGHLDFFAHSEVEYIVHDVLLHGIDGRV
jgi:hypothetical protein